MERNLISDNECLLMYWAAHLCMIKIYLVIIKTPRLMSGLENSFSSPQPNSVITCISSPLVSLFCLTQIPKNSIYWLIQVKRIVSHNENLSKVLNSLVFRKYLSSYSERRLNMWGKYLSVSREKVANMRP